MNTQLNAKQEAVVAVLRQIGDLTPDDTAIHFVECGLHSGFPPCCVVFFVQVWWPTHVMEGIVAEAPRDAGADVRLPPSARPAAQGSLAVELHPVPEVRALEEVRHDAEVLAALLATSA